MLTAHVLPWPDGPDDWKVVYFPPEMMKGRRPHAIPVPSRVALLFDRAATGGRESGFVFPATRATEGEDAPLSRWSVATLIDRLRGRPADTTAYTEARKKAEENGEPPDELPDLLEGLPDFSPHDFRRTFATVCEDMAVRGDAISAVLDHVDTSSGKEPIRTAEITRLAYAYSQRLSLKQIAMEAWTNAVFDAVEKEWEANRPRSSMRMPPRPRQPEYGSPGWNAWAAQIKVEADMLASSTFSHIGPWYKVLERERELRQRIRRPFRTLNRPYDEADECE